MSAKCWLYNPLVSLTVENVHLNIDLFLDVTTRVIVIIGIFLFVMG